MISRPALSTPRPLPRKREHAEKRPAIALASVNGTSTQSDCSGLTPAKAIQKDEAPLARRKPRWPTRSGRSLAIKPRRTRAPGQQPPASRWKPA